MYSYSYSDVCILTTWWSFSNPSYSTFFFTQERIKIVILFIFAMQIGETNVYDSQIPNVNGTLLSVIRTMYRCYRMIHTYVYLCTHIREFVARKSVEYVNEQEETGSTCDSTCESRLHWQLEQASAKIKDLKGIHTLAHAHILYTNANIQFCLDSFSQFLFRYCFFISFLYLTLKNSSIYVRRKISLFLPFRNSSVL